MPITLRRARLDDQPFLFELYRSTRSDEMAAWSWPASEQEAFLKMQFNAQKQYYNTQFPRADYQIVLLDEWPIGRLIIKRGEDETRLVDIALLSEHRNLGIGTALIQNLLDEADHAHKPVRLHVSKFNPAVRLYERLGFSKIDETATHFLMERNPQAS